MAVPTGSVVGVDARRPGWACALVEHPSGAVLHAPDHCAASALHRTLVDGKGMSIQTWHILGKVAEVDAALTDAAVSEATPLSGRGRGGDADRRVVEVHPELSFAALAGHPLREQTERGRPGRQDRSPADLAAGACGERRPAGERPPRRAGRGVVGGPVA